MFSIKISDFIQTAQEGMRVSMNQSIYTPGGMNRVVNGAVTSIMLSPQDSRQLLLVAPSWLKTILSRPFNRASDIDV
jgi:hypothetical protein